MERYKWSVLVLFLFGMNLTHAQFENSNVRGVWYNVGQSEPENFSWNANWIWDADEAHDALLFRKSFLLSNEGGESMLRITATSYYQLYINGLYIACGPARCAPHHQSYDIWDLGKLLKKGSNSIAVRVHHLEGVRSYDQASRPGLLLQLDIRNGEESKNIISDNSWKVCADSSWLSTAPKISRFQPFVNDRVDFRLALKNWETATYDDSHWKNAVPLLRNSGWPSVGKNAVPQALTNPWYALVPRDLPYLEERNIVPEHLVVRIDTLLENRADPVYGSINLKNTIPEEFAGEPITVEPISAQKDHLLVLDFGRVVNGMPYLKMKGDKNTVVEILSAPYVIDRVFTHKLVDSDFRDQLVLSGSEDTWMATYFKPVRYMVIGLKNVESQIIIEDIGVKEIAYPFEEKGSIRSEDAAWIGNYMQASAKTLITCTTDAYTDNYRERRQYAQTGYYAALGNYWIFGDFALQRRYLTQVAQEQFANGIMPAYAPLAGDDYMVIFDSNLLWIRSLHNYLLYSGDYKTTKSLLPAAIRLMELAHSYTNTGGLLNNVPYAYWLDHAINDRRGANLTLNGHYLGALEDFARVMQWCGDEDAEKYEERASNLRNSMKDAFWNEDKKLFSDALVDGGQSKLYSEHGNAMALAMNIASEKQAGEVAGQVLEEDNHNYIQRESGVTMVTPAMSYFLHKGLCEYGYIDESFQLFRSRFDKMLDPSTNMTLWEEWWLDGTGRTGRKINKTRSDAQTESAFPPALFAEYLLGVKVLKPGFELVEINKPLSSINNIEANIPTPQGALEVRWNKKESKGLTLELTVPENVKVAVNPTKYTFIDGKKIQHYSKFNNQELILLEEGSYKLMEIE